MIYGRTIVASVTPTLQIAGAYDAGDVMGGLLTFALQSAGGGGILQSLAIIDDDDEKADVTLYLFDDVPSTILDDAAFAPTLADLKKIVYVKNVASASYSTLNSNAFYFLGGIEIGYRITKGNLYGYLVCTATPTYTAATDLTLRLTVRAD